MTALPITRVGGAAIANSSITIPAGHQVGDLMVMYAFRSALTAPTIPGGWTTLVTASTGASSHSCAYRYAQSGAETSGVWANAEELVCVVYRGGSTSSPAPLVLGVATSTSNALIFVATTARQAEPGTSWIVAFAATKTTDSTIDVAPAGLTNFASAVGGGEAAGHDSNGVYPSTGTWPSTNESIGGTSAEWRTIVLEIYAEQVRRNADVLRPRPFKPGLAR